MHTAPAHHPDAIRRLLQRIDAEPGERRARQLDLLSGVRAVYLRDYGHVPLWWATLKGEVEDGRL